MFQLGDQPSLGRDAFSVAPGVFSPCPSDSHSPGPPTRRTLSGMDRSTCVSLVRTLEDDPSRVPAYFSALEEAIRWLMDATFESTDPDAKVRLAFTEMRARLVWERFRKMNAN